MGHTLPVCAGLCTPAAPLGGTEMPSENENPNITFARNWTAGSPIALDGLSDRSAEVLGQADKNHDGVVTMREARDRLIVNSRVLSDSGSKAFEAEIELFLLEKTGHRVDVTTTSTASVSHICYIQLNNARNQKLREEQDLLNIAQRDPDRPTLDTLNLTESFNTNGNVQAATAAFRSAMCRYFDGLLMRGHRMSGFVISGHSDGTRMLQETPDHQYYSNLEPRAVLRELREQNLAYRELMDGCEKMAALACFQGGALNEWAELFPNASLAGTRMFAPLSSSAASAALFDQAASAHQILEDAAGDTTAARKAAAGVQYSSALRSSEPALHVPVHSEEVLAKARTQLLAAESSYKRIEAEIQEIRKKGAASFAQSLLDRAYAVANTYCLALHDLWIAQGRPGGAQGSAALRLAQAQFEVRDLFAIRKHLPRPEAPARFDPTGQDYA